MTPLGRQAGGWEEEPGATSVGSTVPVGTAAPAEPEAILVAFEEVVVGSHAIWSAVTRAMLSGYGLAGRDGLLADLATASPPQAARMIAEELGQSILVERIEHYLERQLTAQLACDVHLVPGAIRLLRRLRLECPLAVTSSAPQELLHGALQGAGIGDFFTAEVGEGPGRRRLPAPDIHLEAARRLGVSPARVLAVEASEAGALGALAAGMRVVRPEAIHAAVQEGPIDFSQVMRQGALDETRRAEPIETAGP